MGIKQRFLVVGGKRFKVYYLEIANIKTYKTNHKIVTDFSKAKLGDLKAIQKYAFKMATMIKKKIDIEDIALVANNPSAIRKNTAYCIAEEIAQIIDKPFKKILYLSKIPTNKYYTKMTVNEKKEVMKKTLYFKGPNIKGKNIILIDDCITSGIILKSCIQKLLDNGAKQIHCFVYLNVSTTRNEDRYGKNILLERGIKPIIKIIQDKHNPLVTRLIGAIFELSTDEIIQIFNSLSGARKKELLDTMLQKTKTRDSLKPKMKEILEGLKK